MSDKIPKWAYVLIGTLLVVLIVVAFVSLVTSGGLLSKFTATGVIGAAVLVLFFGHQHYQREHTVVGQLKGFGQDMAGLVGFGSERGWFEKMTGSSRRKK
jgi:hypothetical protein|uniref:Uncharacterized protein n=1 Tax=viral metagenome TaxID=1070528 RepID=A0A6C0B0Q2_9ZZZZ